MSTNEYKPSAPENEGSYPFNFLFELLTHRATPYRPTLPLSYKLTKNVKHVYGGVLSGQFFLQ